MKLRYLKVLSATVLTAAVLGGCGLDAASEDPAESAAVPAAVTSREYVKTTKTASRRIEADNDDEVISDYTTTTEITGATLENSYSVDDEPDPDILATLTTTTTLYTLPEGAKTTKTEKSAKKTTGKTASAAKTTTTALAPDKLYKPLTADKFKKKKKYKVVSDTTYLNLRFGPSKKYEVQLKIPDGESIYGTAQSSAPDDKEEKWVYVSYRGTSGWVMRGLLEECG